MRHKPVKTKSGPLQNFQQKSQLDRVDPTLVARLLAPTRPWNGSTRRIPLGISLDRTLTADPPSAHNAPHSVVGRSVGR